jgi:4-aminobutyrate aminotransferase/(S)-3-amino-2-methylpropionate transaminase
MDSVAPGGLGGTYAGNPVACAAALGAIEAIESEGLLERSRALGDRMAARLQGLAMPCIGEVRHLGAMLAVEFVKDRIRQTPDPDLTGAVVAEALRRGLILLSCGMYGNALRIMVPLTASDAIVDEGLGIIEAALGAVVARAA